MEQETQLRTMKEGGEEEQNKTAEDIKTESMKIDTTGEGSDTVTGELDSVDKDIHTNSYGPECTKTSTADEDITVSLDRDSKVLETLLLDKKEKPVETVSNLEEEKEIELVKILVNKENKELEASVMGIQLEELQNKQKNEVQGTETTEIKQAKEAENMEIEVSMVIEKKAIEPVKEIKAMEKIENKQKCSVKRTESARQTEKKEMEYAKILENKELGPSNVTEVTKISGNGEIEPMGMIENKEMQPAEVTQYKVESDEALKNKSMKETDSMEKENKKLAQSKENPAKQSEPRRIIEDDGNNGAIEQVKSENVGVSECAEDKKIESIKILEEKETFSPGIKGNDEMELGKLTEEGEAEEVMVIEGTQTETVTPVRKKFKLSVCDETIERQEISKETNHCRDYGEKNCRVGAEIFVNRSDISTEDCTDEENSVIEIEDEEKPESEGEDKDEKEMTQSQDEDTYCSEEPAPESSNETLEGTTSFGDVSQATSADVELETTHTEDDMFATQVDTADSSGTDYADFKGSKLMQSSSTMSQSLSVRKCKLSESDTVGRAPKLQCIEVERSLSKYTTKDEKLTVTDATSRKLVFEPDVDKPKFVLVATEVSQRKPRESIEVLYMKSKSDTTVDVVDLVEDSQLDSSEDLCLRLSPSPTPRTQELSSYSSCKRSNRNSENDKRKRDGTTVSLDNDTPSSGPQQQKQQQELSEDALTPVTDMSSIESDATQKLMGCEQRRMLMEMTVELKYTLHDNKVVQRRVLQCHDVTGEFLNAMTRKLSDCSSSGGLADSSSKNSSPSSSSSGPGPFALQPTRKSLMSLLSGSSSSSGGSSVAQHAVLGVKQMSGQFVVPNPPKKPTPDKSVEGVEHIIQTLSNIEREMLETNRSPKITETPKSRMVPLNTSTAKKKCEFTKKIESKTEEKTPAEATLKPGQQVFARWTDRKYYSGKVKEIGKDGRLLVNFDDGNSKSLVADFVIPVKELDKGQSVYALADEEEYLSGVIVKVEKKRSDTVYSVELDEGQNVSVSRSSIFMTEDQAKTLKEVIAAASPMKSTPQRITDVSLDNVLEGKRSRTRSKDVQKLLESPGVSGVGKRKVSSPVSSESDLGSAVDCVDGVELETPGREIKSGRVKGLRKGTATKNELSDEFGPVPEAGSRIFAGKCFLLTHSDAKLERSVSEVSDVDMTDYEELMFSKSYLTKQIQAGGGDVYARFEDVPPSKYKSCYLVANKSCQTALYILCLAHGIDIVISTWIIVSCKENVCVPISNYVLPAGYSLEKKDFVSRSKKQPLQKMKVGLVSDVKFFIKFWKKVLEAAGASVCAIPPQRTMKEMKDLQVLVSNHCPFEVYKQIQELGKPLVTTTWVVQCLVNGSRLSYTGHCDYSYNQAQSDE